MNPSPSDSKTTQKKTSEGLKCEGQDGPCDRMDATRQRQNTAYVDDELNWVTLCPECMESNEQFWKERWEEVYGRTL